MHIDFHYYATYAMARATGLAPQDCQIIASAAQFVDDNDEDENSIWLEDGGRLNRIPTAHPLIHIENTEYFDNDQRTVWLPFHFLPGNEGESMSERLVCRKDSKIAREMMETCQSMIKKEFGLYLVGIASHVYADTFSHYGFSGISSRWNKVDADSIILKNSQRDSESEAQFENKYGRTMGGLLNWRNFLKNFKSDVAELGTGALGHGAVLKYPDYPFLDWEFKYEHSSWDNLICERDNPSTFLEACEKLHGVFCNIGVAGNLIRTDECLDFDNIQDKIQEILGYKNIDKFKRAEVWCKAALMGELFSKDEEILPYLGETWKDDIKELENDHPSSIKVRDKPIFRFYQAAAFYRTYVLRELLPKYGLIMD